MYITCLKFKSEQLFQNKCQFFSNASPDIKCAGNNYCCHIWNKFISVYAFNAIFFSRRLVIYYIPCHRLQRLICRSIKAALTNGKDQLLPLFIMINLLTPSRTTAAARGNCRPSNRFPFIVCAVKNAILMDDK